MFSRYLVKNKFKFGHYLSIRTIYCIPCFLFTQALIIIFNIKFTLLFSFTSIHPHRSSFFTTIHLAFSMHYFHFIFHVTIPYSFDLFQFLLVHVAVHLVADSQQSIHIIYSDGLWPKASVWALRPIDYPWFLCS